MVGAAAPCSLSRWSVSRLTSFCRDSFSAVSLVSRSFRSFCFCCSFRSIPEMKFCLEFSSSTDVISFWNVMCFSPSSVCTPRVTTRCMSVFIAITMSLSTSPG